MPSNWQAESEMFRLHEPESTSPRNEIVLLFRCTRFLLVLRTVILATSGCIPRHGDTPIAGVLTLMAIPFIKAARCLSFTLQEKKNMTMARRGLALLAALAIAAPVLAQDKITLRMSTPASATDQRSVALAEILAPAVADFAMYEPHYNASLIKQNSELEAIASGDLEMSITSAQELAQYFPEFSILRPAMSIRTQSIRFASSTRRSWTPSSRKRRTNWA